VQLTSELRLCTDLLEAYIGIGLAYALGVCVVCVVECGVRVFGCACIQILQPISGFEESGRKMQSSEMIITTSVQFARSFSSHENFRNM